MAVPHRDEQGDRSRQAREAGFQQKVEVILFLNRTLTTLEQGVNASTFRMGCTPVVNLFEQIAEPIPLTHTRFEYRVLPDVARPQGLEVYSVDSVTNVDPATSSTREYQPFYSFRHGRTREDQETFWYSSRRPSLMEGDRGTEVYINLVDLKFNPRLPAEQVLVVRTTCTNRDLPGQLQRAGEALSFELEAAAPVARILCLRTPTMTLRRSTSSSSICSAGVPTSASSRPKYTTDGVFSSPSAFSRMEACRVRVSYQAALHLDVPKSIPMNPSLIVATAPSTRATVPEATDQPRRAPLEGLASSFPSRPTLRLVVLHGRSAHAAADRSDRPEQTGGSTRPQPPRSCAS